MRRIRQLLSRVKIGQKLIIVFLATSMIALGVNLFVYINLNTMLERIDAVYSTNINLNKLADDVKNVHAGLTGYLETKGTDDLELYYRYSQVIDEEIEDLNDQPTDNALKLGERNVRNLSKNYLATAEKAIRGKRARNVELYTRFYNECCESFEYLNTYIYSLNNETFRTNSESFNTMISSLHYSQFLCLSIFIIVSLMNVLLIILLTSTITRPLTKLSEKAKEISSGNPENVEPLMIDSNDEIGHVTRAFNRMLVSIKEYIGRIREQMVTESAMKEKSLLMENHLKDAQLKYLQAQINPHFLFNTLNAGAQLAMMEDAKRTGDYIQKMADFFRYNVKKDNEKVRIAEEIELVDSYIYIMNVRFSGEISFRKEIDESLLDVIVPSMILQPIFENSVKYGIDNLDERSIEIVLSLYKKDRFACVEIRDNGKGMDQKIIDQLLSRQPLEYSKKPDDEKSVGLTNVIARLDNFFNGKEKIEIKSAENQGTSVIIWIPRRDETCIE